MKTYLTEQIKNISILGNSGSGKTTLTEAMLYEGGVIERRGEVENKNTVSDFTDVEHENQISVFDSVLYTEFMDKKINFIDTPGLDDFNGGVFAALKVTDLGLVVLNAQNGFEVGTEITGRYLEDKHKPAMFVINQLDHEKANYEKTIEELRERFGSNLICIQYPVNPGTGFNAIVDVLMMKLYKYPQTGGAAEILEIPEEEKEKALKLHQELVEKAAENDEKLMEQFFDKGTLEPDDVRKGVTIGFGTCSIYPVFCVSAKKDIGVARLMEFIRNVAPDPSMAAPAITTEGKEIKCDSKAPVSLFFFKTALEPHIGIINYFKVMSGELIEGLDLNNNNNGIKERISQIFVSAGKNRIKVDKLVAGDIGATVKLKSTKANHTLGIENYQFEPIVYPTPKYRTAIKALKEDEEEKLGDALARYHEEDPTIIVEYSKELKQIIIHGQGEYHLNILKWHLDNIYKIATEFLPPRIPYRETITKVAQSSYRHKKQSGGAGQFGEVSMIIEPYYEGMPDTTSYKLNGKELKVSIRSKESYDLSWGGKLLFYNCIVGGAIDARFMPAILKGIMEKMEQGPLTGSYARDIRVLVYDGKMHPVDSNEISFKLAGRNAFKEAFKNAGPKIMEPIYHLEVFVPSDRMGDVMSDLQSRRALVLGMDREKGLEKITARVPLAEMNKYSTALSSLTQGRAMYSMKFLEYAQVPADIQSQLLKAYEETEKEE
ncbi:MAG: elongation factor G [Bacteroidota bacterium]|nr:elongation factor G [Bacteroidota bacterium]